MTQLVWFRNDLRTGDNPALTAACKKNQPVRACFVVTPEQWQTPVSYTHLTLPTKRIV